MKRAIVFGLVLVVAVICLAQSSETTKLARSADDVLKSYAERVYAELLPRVSELRSEEVIQLAGTIAAEVLVPHRDLLFEKAKAELAELPKLTVDLGKDWESVAEVNDGEIASGYISALGPLTSQPATEPVNRDAILLLSFWNARTAASFVRTQVLVRHFGPKEFGQRAMIEALARPMVYAISADAQRPVLAIETGPEMFVVNLKHTDEGYFVDEGIRWLKRKVTASQPAPAAGKD